MDIDVGKIDRIKIWHDNSNLGAALFLESIIIYKKYSTCYTISNIYNQRLQHVSKAIYRQASDPMKKNLIGRTHSNDDDNVSIDRQSIKSNDSAKNRSILRGLAVYHKSNSRKKVTWDEQSISSHDDLFSIDSQRAKLMQSIEEGKSHKKDSLSHLSHPTNHDIYWISSHNYIDNNWKINSIEESNLFDFDSSIRSLLLSDRSIVRNNIKSSINENDDEIYECQVNAWLKKDEPNDKVEISLTPKLIHKSSLSSDVHHSSKRTHVIPYNTSLDIQHKQSNNQEQSIYPSPYDVKPIEKTSRNSNLNNLRSSSSQLSNKSKQEVHHSQSLQENLNSSSRSNATLKMQNESPGIHSAIDKYPHSTSLTPHLRSTRHTNDSINRLGNEQELLARITMNEPLHQTKLAHNQHLNSPLDRSLSMNSEKLPSEKSNRMIPPLTRITDERLHSPRSTTTFSSRNLKSSHDFNDQIISQSAEEELLKRITHQSSYRSQASTLSSSSLTTRAKLASNTDTSTNPLINKRETLLKMPIEQPVYSRSTMPSPSSFTRLSKSSSSHDEPIGSSSKISTESILRSKPSLRHSNQDVSLQKSISSKYLNLINNHLYFYIY